MFLNNLQGSLLMWLGFVVVVVVVVVVLIFSITDGGVGNRATGIASLTVVLVFVAAAVGGGDINMIKDGFGVCVLGHGHGRSRCRCCGSVVMA